MRVWATERTYKKKTWFSFSTSIGKKNEDEEYDNVYFDVLFKKNEAPEVDECVDGHLRVQMERAEKIPRGRRGRPEE